MYRFGVVPEYGDTHNMIDSDGAEYIVIDLNAPMTIDEATLIDVVKYY